MIFTFILVEAMVQDTLEMQPLTLEQSPYTPLCINNIEFENLKKLKNLKNYLKFYFDYMGQ